MKTAVVAVRRNTRYTAHLVQIPWRKNQESTIDTCIKTLPFRFPKSTDGFFLQVYQWKASIQTLLFHQSLPFRDA